MPQYRPGDFWIGLIVAALLGVVFWIGVAVTVGLVMWAV